MGYLGKQKSQEREKEREREREDRTDMEVGVCFNCWQKHKDL